MTPASRRETTERLARVACSTNGATSRIGLAMICAAVILATAWAVFLLLNMASAHNRNSVEIMAGAGLVLAFVIAALSVAFTRR